MARTEKPSGLGWLGLGSRMLACNSWRMAVWAAAAAGRCQPQWWGAAVARAGGWGRGASQECWETRRFPALVVQELSGCVGCLHVASVPQNRTCLCSTPVTMSFCCDSQFFHFTRVTLAPAQHVVEIHVNHKRVGDPPTQKT